MTQPTLSGTTERHHQALIATERLSGWAWLRELVVRTAGPDAPRAGGSRYEFALAEAMCALETAVGPGEAGGLAAAGVDARAALDLLLDASSRLGSGHAA